MWGPKKKKKMWGPLFKMIKNFSMATAEDKPNVGLSERRAPV